MNTKTKVVIAGVVILVAGVMLLPRLAQRIDSAVGPALERGAALEAIERVKPAK